MINEHRISASSMPVLWWEKPYVLEKKNMHDKQAESSLLVFNEKYPKVFIKSKRKEIFLLLYYCVCNAAFPEKPTQDNVH